MNAYPPRRWAHMRRACAAWSLDRLEACSITQTLAPARSTKSEPRDALSDACNMTSRKEGALGRRRGRSCRGRALPAGRSDEHTSELQSLTKLVCRLLLEKQ